MLKIVCVTLLLTLYANADVYNAEPLPNSCFVNALAFKDAISSYDGRASKEAQHLLEANSDRWTAIIIIQFRDNFLDKPAAHAICVFDDNGIIRAYDPNYGTYSLDIPSGWHDAIRIVSRIKWKEEITGYALIDERSNKTETQVAVQ